MTVEPIENIIIGQENDNQGKEERVFFFFFSCSLNEGTDIFILHMPGKLCNLHCDGVWEY